MKALLALMLFLAVLAAGYFGIPLILERQTEDVRASVRGMEGRLEALEAYIGEEKRAVETTGLLPDSDRGKIVASVNSLSLRLKAAEEGLKMAASSMDAEKNGRRQFEAELSMKLSSEVSALSLQIGMLDVMARTIRAKSELEERNIGRAKAELETLEARLAKASETASEEQRRKMNELAAVIKKARAEVETNLPSALSRLDIVWGETAQMLGP